MALDLLESIKKTSADDPIFINISTSEFQEVKKELIQLLSSDGQKNELIQDKKMRLIGTLPYVLMDKMKFPNNESIVKLAENSLDYKISSWKKRGREEMIGLIIAKIAEDDGKQFEKFMDVWKEFVTVKDFVEYKKLNKDFVDVWLDFFNQNRSKK